MSKLSSNNTTSRRAALGSLAAIAATVPVSAVAAAVCTADPIYTLIDAHKVARAVFSAATANEPPFKTVAHGLWELNTAHAADREQEATVALLTTPPTTVSGAVALLRYIAETDTDGEAYHTCDCGEAGSAFSALINSLIATLAPLVQQ